MKNKAKMYSPLVKRVLDGEITLAELPPELRAEGEEALRVLDAVDRTPVALPRTLDAAVMATVRRRARSPARRIWRWMASPRELELRLRLRPVALIGGALTAACVVLLLSRGPAATPPGSVAGHAGTESVVAEAAAPEPVVSVRFILYAPQARRVAVAGSFNQWDQNAAPLIPMGREGVWMTTLPLPVGQHQYAFVVDGERWLADPAAPAVDDGFGRRNSIIAVTIRRGQTS